MRVTPKNLSRLEDLLVSLGYKVRYELGNFQGGYCVLDKRRIIVINKYYPIDGRVSTLLEFINTLDINAILTGTELDDEQKKILREAARPESATDEQDKNAKKKISA